MNILIALIALIVSIEYINYIDWTHYNYNKYRDTLDTLQHGVEYIKSDDYIEYNILNPMTAFQLSINIEYHFWNNY